jgi:hypothetical protein
LGFSLQCYVLHARILHPTAPAPGAFTIAKDRAPALGGEKELTQRTQNLLRDLYFFRLIERTAACSTALRLPEDGTRISSGSGLKSFFHFVVLVLRTQLASHPSGLRPGIQIRVMINPAVPIR